MFAEREVKCEICGELLAVYGCCQPANIDDKQICAGCKKAVEDAIEQRKYLQGRKSNGS